ncbi:hypothetical protein NMY22_g10663 [Coprinellus aureogranulatus]|nr:hypothetical protein NMY22_g10663 [Coprinellus aureogranulatus]
MWGAAASSTSADSCCGEVLPSRLLCGPFFRPRPPTPNLRMSLGDEKQLVQSEERVMPVIQPLQDGDVWKAARVWDLAFRDDPVLNYIDAVSSVYMRIYNHQSLAGCEGNANEKLVEAFYIHFRSVGLDQDDDSHYHRWWSFCGGSRANEYSEKVKAVVQAKLGDRIKLMMSVPLVMTVPDRQGRGYASALLREMTNLADTRQEAFALVSINKANEGFYNSHGFQSVGEALLGEGNPASFGFKSCFANPGSSLSMGRLSPVKQTTRDSFALNSPSKTATYHVFKNNLPGSMSEKTTFGTRTSSTTPFRRSAAAGWKHIQRNPSSEALDALASAQPQTK